MNRLLALLAVLLLVVLAAGCGGSKKSSHGGASTSAVSSKKIGLVTDVGGLNDKGFNHLSYVGLQEAKTRLGVQTHVNLSAASGEYVPNLTAFARQNYALIIAVGVTEANPIDTAATQSPKNKLASVDVAQTTERHTPPNLLALLS